MVAMRYSSGRGGWGLFLLGTYRAGYAGLEVEQWCNAVKGVQFGNIVYIFALVHGSGQGAICAQAGIDMKISVEV